MKIKKWIIIYWGNSKEDLSHSSELLTKREAKKLFATKKHVKYLAKIKKIKKG